MTKTAKVTYKPDKGNVTDTITVKRDGKTLISKDVYIAPHINWNMSVSGRTSLSLVISGLTEHLILNNFKIRDNLNKTIKSEETLEVYDLYKISIDYPPVASQVETGVQLTISYELKGYSFVHKTQTVPVYATYRLTIDELNDSTIDAGETIQEFKCDE